MFLRRSRFRDPNDRACGDSSIQPLIRPLYKHVVVASGITLTHGLLSGSERVKGSVLFCLAHPPVHHSDQNPGANSVILTPDIRAIPHAIRLTPIAAMYLCGLVLCLVAACRTPDRPIPVVSAEVLTLKTEWPYSPQWSGVFTDPDTGEELIFSGDPITHLTVRIFDQMGAHLRDIPLGPALDSLGSISSFTLIARDSLFVLEEHGPKYAIVDLQGRVARLRSLEKVLCDPHGDRYYVIGHTNGLAWLGGALYLEAVWVSACSDTSEDDTSSPFLVFQRYFAQATRKCKVAKLRPYDKVDGLRFGACDILPHLTDTPRCTIGGVQRVAANGKLFVISPYSPFILQLDTASLEIARKIPLHFANGPVGITPPPISAEDVQNEGYNIRSMTKASAILFVHDTPSAHYFVVVLHEVQETTIEQLRISSIERDWSLLVLDAAFNQIAQHVVPGKAYRGGVMLSLKRGTWVLEARHGREAATQAKVFHRLHAP